jgi:cytochrome c556
MNRTTVARKLGLGLAAIIVAAGLSASVSSHAQDNMMLMKDRVALMKAMGKNLGMIGKAAKGETTADYPALSEAAAVIRDNAGKLKGMFPTGSGGGESRALPAVWQDKADFDARLVKLANAADAFANDAASKQMNDLQASFGAVASNCGGCHKMYRAEKK